MIGPKLAKKCVNTVLMVMDYGHPERPFCQKYETFGLGHTNWAEIYEVSGVFLAKV